MYKFKFQYNRLLFIFTNICVAHLFNIYVHINGRSMKVLKLHFHCICFAMQQPQPTANCNIWFTELDSLYPTSYSSSSYWVYNRQSGNLVECCMFLLQRWNCRRTQENNYSNIYLVWNHLKTSFKTISCLVCFFVSLYFFYVYFPFHKLFPGVVSYEGFHGFYLL